MIKSSRKHASKRKARKATTRSEKEIAAVGVKWLIDNGWTVLEELTVKNPETAERRAATYKGDLIATKMVNGFAEIVVWEVKPTLTAQVIVQAARWRGLAHRVAILTAHSGRAPSAVHRKLLKLAVQETGLSVIYVTLDNEVRFRSSDPKAPSRRGKRNPQPNIAPIMLAVKHARDREQQRIDQGAPSTGSKAGSPSPLGEKGLDTQTRWRRLGVEQYVAANPGATSKEIKRACKLSQGDTAELIRQARAGTLENMTAREFIGQLIFSMKGHRHA